MIAKLPKHLAAMVEFSLQTGLRRANVTHLEWSRVDLGRKTAWVLADQTKNGKALAVPLNERAISVLQGSRGKHARWVFTVAGKPVRQTSTRAWYKALARAGIEDFC